MNRYIFLYSLGRIDVQGVKVRKQASYLVGVLVLAGLLAGCASEKEALRTADQPAVVSAPDIHSEAALQHFIDGSLCEMKGEFAQAILEYQDALRDEQNHAIYFALAKCYSALGKHSLAIEAGREAVKRAPDNLDYRRNLAGVYVAAYELDLAIEQYEDIVKHDSSGIDAWYSLARLYQTRKPLKALEVYDRITERFGPQWDVLLQEADLCNKLGKFEKSADALSKMLEIDPGNQELKRTLGQTYVRGGDFDKAQKVFSDLREVDPDNVEVIADLAGVYLFKKDYPKAALLFENILSRDSVTLDAKLRIGEMYFSQMEKDSTIAPQAQTMFERIRDKHPEDWRAYWFLGAIGSLEHDDSLSVRSFKKVTELASWNADAWVYLSGVFMGKNNFEEVSRILEAALRVLPDDFRVNFFLGVAYNRLGRNLDAARVLEHARQINGKDLDAITQLALVYDGMKRFDESDSLYEEALKIDPKNHLVLNNYGYSLADRGLQLERALEMSKKAVEAQPENASYLDTLGWIFFRLGKYKDAEKYVKDAISKGEANAVVLEHLGDIYYKLNDREAAMEQWNMALRMDSTNTALREKIARGSL